MAEYLPANPTAEQVKAFFEKLPSIRSTFPDARAFYNAYSLYFNCYAYAAGSLGTPFIIGHDGKPFATFAVPGALANQRMKIFTSEALHDAVVADGFQSVDPASYASGNTKTLKRHGYTLVASFIDSTVTDGNSASFHFAVRDEHGQWTHKNGDSEILTRRDGIAGGDLRDPHLHPEDYLGSRYRFAGYYWRPDAGIHVIGGETPVTPFDKSGHMVESGRFDPQKILRDAWVGARGDYISTSFAIKDVSLESQGDGAFTLRLTRADGEPVTLRIHPSLVFKQYGNDWKETGNKVIELADPVRDLSIELPPSGGFRVVPGIESDIGRRGSTYDR